MEHEKQFIEEWNSSVVIKKLMNKRTRQVDKNSNFKLREIQQPEIIINNISELSKEERKKCIFSYLYRQYCRIQKRKILY